jgi:hypothetical protein
MSGFITLHRKLLDWEWYNDTNTKSLFLHCLLKANWENKHWQGIEIKKGSFITSLNELSKELKLSNQRIRTSLSKLEKTKEIVVKSTNKYTLLTIVKYRDYQDKENKSTNKQQSNNNQITTTNNITTKPLKPITKKNTFTPPNILAVEIFFDENGYDKILANKVFNYYNDANWKDVNGKQVLSWKQKMRAVWMKDENKKEIKLENQPLKMVY